MNYNNSINEAKLQNNSVLAEIAYNTLTQQLELITEGTMYKNSLILELADKKLQLEQMRDNNWYKVLDQINTENALAEDVRQFNENLEFQTTQAELDREFKAKQAEIDRQFEEQQAALNRQHDFKLLEAKTEAERKLAKEEHERAMAKLAQQHKNDLAVLEKQYEISKRSSSASFSSGSSSKSSGSSSKSKSAKSAATSALIKNANPALASTKKTNNTSNTSAKKAPVDMQSVLDLGGPYNASYVASLVNSGKAKVTTKNGKTTFSYNNPSSALDIRDYYRKKKNE
jgi:hypothetical protein